VAQRFSHVIYNQYSDNIAPDAAITVQTGTAADGYDPSWIADRNSSRPSKLEETSGAWVFDFGSAMTVELFALLHANFVEGLVFHLQANATNVWTSPTMNVAITMPAWRAGRFPGQPWKDLRGEAGYAAFQYWRLVVSSGTPNSVALSVGDVWMGSAFRTLNLQTGDTPTHSRPQIEHSTSYRKLRYRLASTVRSWKGTIPASDAVRDEIVDWILDADGRPVLFIPEHNDPVPEAWTAIHQTTAQDVTQTFTEANFLPLAVEEDGRGLEPTPSPLA
jgi:hypothetical protein